MDSCQCSHTGHTNHSKNREKQKSEAMCLACACYRKERHAHCRVRDDGVPVLHVEPIRARLRQLGVVVPELELDDFEVVTPRTETQHCGRAKKKNANLGKRDN